MATRSAGNTAAQRTREFKALMRRAASLGKELEGQQHGARELDTGPWAELQKALEAWAKKYGLPSADLTFKTRAAGTARVQRGQRLKLCPVRMETTRGWTCVLKKEKRDGTCIYKCYPSPSRRG